MTSIGLTPTISVVMPVYNGGAYLSAAIDSILHQTFSDFELLIINDGSTDGSQAILETYAAMDDRIRLTHRHNKGIVATLNEMLAQAKGEFIARMDADDIALPDRFARQVEFLNHHPQVICVGSNPDWIDKKGYLLGNCPMPESDEEIQHLLVGGISILHHPSTMFRRLTALAVGGYDETMVTSCDLDLWLRLGEVGKLANLPEPLFQYRLYEKSITQSRQIQQANDALDAYKRAWKRRGIEGKFIRQPDDHLNHHDFFLKIGQVNFVSGKRYAARRCGIRAIATRPLAIAGWKLLARALIKPLPKIDSL